MGSVLGTVLGAAFVLQVVVAVLTNAHRRRNLQPLDFRLEATAPGRRTQEERPRLQSQKQNKTKKKEAKLEKKG